MTLRGKSRTWFHKEDSFGEILRKEFREGRQERISRFFKKEKAPMPSEDHVTAELICGIELGESVNWLCPQAFLYGIIGSNETNTIAYEMARGLGFDQTWLIGITVVKYNKATAETQLMPAPLSDLFFSIHSAKEHVARLRFRHRNFDLPPVELP